MLISRRSPRKSKLFRSRFRDSSSGNFPLRQYLRCREEVFAGSVHLGLLVAFIVAMALFGRTLNRLFIKHGADVAAWVRWMVLALVVSLILLLIRRGFRRFTDIREAWQEMRQLRAELPLRPHRRSRPREPSDDG